MVNKMNIQGKLIQNYPLINKVDSELNCYLLDKKRYLVFWDELIKKDSTEEVLKYLEEKKISSEIETLKNRQKEEESTIENYKLLKEK